MRTKTHILLVYGTRNSRVILKTNMLEWPGCTGKKETLPLNGWCITLTVQFVDTDKTKKKAYPTSSMKQGVSSGNASSSIALSDSFSWISIIRELHIKPTLYQSLLWYSLFSILNRSILHEMKTSHCNNVFSESGCYAKSLSNQSYK